MSKRKIKAAPETEQQRLARIVEERAAAARYSFKHGLRENETDQSNLIAARFDLARRIALDLNHTPLKQGISYECYRCGGSGTFDVEPIGEIFIKQCATVATEARIAAVIGNEEERAFTKKVATEAHIAAKQCTDPERTRNHELGSDKASCHTCAMTQTNDEGI